MLGRTRIKAAGCQNQEKKNARTIEKIEERNARLKDRELVRELVIASYEFSHVFSIERRKEESQDKDGIDEIGRFLNLPPKIKFLFYRVFCNVLYDVKHSDFFWLINLDAKKDNDSALNIKNHLLPYNRWNIVQSLSYRSRFVFIFVLFFFFPFFILFLQIIVIQWQESWKRLKFNYALYVNNVVFR